MDTASAAAQAESRVSHMLSVKRLVVAGSVTASVVFVLCWLGTFIPFSSPTHAYIGLFTPEEVKSVNALMEGSLWSLLFGGLSGGLFALIYNAAAPLGRR